MLITDEALTIHMMIVESLQGQLNIENNKEYVTLPPKRLLCCPRVAERYLSEVMELGCEKELAKAARCVRKAREWKAKRVSHHGR